MSIETFQTAPVRDFFESRPLFSESDRVSTAIGYLRENKEYEVFLTKERRLATVTVRELISVKNPQTTKLDKLAYFIPELRENDTVTKAATLMFDYRLRALPSGADAESVHAVSTRSIARGMLDAGVINRIAASDIMTPSPISIQANDTALKAREIMIRRSIDHLPVMDGARLYGMVTSSHLLFSLLPTERAPSGFYEPESQVRFDYPVKRIADESPLKVEASTQARDVVGLMLKRRSSYVLITVLEEELSGIVTLRDFLRPLISKEKRKAPYYIVGLPEEPFEAEAAKMKFERLAESLLKAFPFIEEIRAIVKSANTKGAEKRRYEVHVNVYTPRDVLAYSEQGYELPELFDAIAPKLKRLLGSKQSKVTRTHGDSLRKIG